MIGGDHPLWDGVLVDLSPAERLVLVCLAAHAGDDDRCWPSVARLARATGYSDRQLRRALTQLRERGLLDVVEWRFTTNKSTVYQLARPPDVSDRGSGLPPDTGDTGPLTPVTGDPLTPTAGPPDTGDREKNHRRTSGRTTGRTTNTRGAQVVALATRTEAPDFGDFWDLWPRKIAKRAAEKAWAAATKRAAPDRIVDGARRYTTGPLPETKYIPHPATWLNGDRWNDDPPAVTANGQRSADEIVARLASKMGVQQ